jgi:hypothetical protein
MSSADVKQIQITGGAELVGGKRRRSRKGAKGGELQVQKGGNCVKGYLNPMLMNAAAPLSEAFKPPMALEEVTRTIPVAAAALPTGMAGGSAVSSGGNSSAVSSGGAKKVELRKGMQPKKVHLHSKKAVTFAKGIPKRKTRKIVLGLVALANRQTRAKKISQRMKEMPIEQLKKQLVEQGLIKVGSKAPESILRQIAADAQIVGGNGL